MIITIKDVRRLNHCTRGARRWFINHGFDWSDFLRNGIDEEKFLATNDSLAQRVVELAKKEDK